jgi:hypothetical protein
VNTVHHCKVLRVDPKALELGDQRRRRRSCSWVESFLRARDPRRVRFLRPCSPGIPGPAELGHDATHALVSRTLHLWTHSMWIEEADSKRAY